MSLKALGTQQQHQECPKEPAGDSAVPPTGQHLGLTFSACRVSEGAPEFSERRGTAGSKREDRLWAAIALVLC